MASTFPRWEGDTEPGFIYEFCKRISLDFNVMVLAPHFHKAQAQENMNNIEVFRFRYFFAKMQKLAYEGGIANNIKNNPFTLLLVPFFLFFNCLSLIRLIKQQHIDIIHAHWIIPQGFTAIIARWITRKKIPVLCTSHGGDMYCFNGYLMRKLKVYILNQCEKITVVSSVMKKDLINWGVDESKIAVISMGVDLQNTFCPDSSISKKNNTVLFVGRLVPKKGVDVLIRSLRYLSDNSEKVLVDIVGFGPEKERFQQLAIDEGVDDLVNFLGAKSYSELPAIYRQYSIIVVPSVTAINGDREGLGLVTIEAIGCGCAAIVSDFDAVFDVIENGKTGIIVKQNSPIELAKAIQKLMSDASLRASFSKRAREYVVNKYDWQNIVKNHTKLFIEMI